MTTTTCERCLSALEEGDLRCPVCALPAPAGGGVARRAFADVLRCDGCGAAVTYDVSARAPACGFCGGVMHVETPEDPLEEPQGWLPFRVSRDEAASALKAWLRTLGWFRPRDLVERASLASLRPLWWCAWIVDADATVSWAADSNAGTRRASWAPHAGRAELVRRGLVLSASRGLSADECAKLVPGYGDEGVSPEPPRMEGATTERFEIQRSAARERIADMLRELSLRTAESEWIPGTRFRNVKVEVLLERLSTRRLALPAHVLAWRYRGKLYRAVVSGRDERLVVGSAPISWWRVAAVVVGVILAVGALMAALLLR